ncbi:MAG TPA: carboxypeptidase-like regulatory domain-containing protein [Vicinamibacterales bacterium]|nr:carboxypeptidase-like regulatory domain-containing protein [Vicinamibacterales bacterium]
MARTPIFAIASLLVVSCNSSTPAGPGGFHPLHEKANSLTVSGPARVAPGTTAKYTATGQMGDATTQDLSTKATWRLSTFNVLTIDASGMATTRNNGETTITAAFGGATASLSVMVLPNGTYRLAGTVRDGDQPVNAAQVRVTSGQGAGQTSITNSLGQYTLYGVAGEVELSVTRQGFATVTHQVAVDKDDVFDITDFTTGDVKLSGTYTLNLIAGSDCAPYPPGMSPPPASELQRSYTATVTQAGPDVTVTLSGADFDVVGGRGNQFTGSIYNGYIYFTLKNSGGDYYYTLNTVGRPDVVERLPSGHLLGIFGYVSAPLTTGGLNGQLWGEFFEFDRAANGSPTKPMTACYSDNNRFQLTPTAGTTRRR